MDSPSENTLILPDDVAALRALVLATFSERNAVAGECDILLEQNDRLRHLLVKLTRMQFGAKSARLPEDQLQLGLEALEQAIAKDDADAEKHDPGRCTDSATKRRASCGTLPAHLPRIEVTLLPDATACCGAAMTMIGEDTSERLKVIPVQYRVAAAMREMSQAVACGDQSISDGRGGSRIKIPQITENVREFAQCQRSGSSHRQTLRITA